MDPIEHRNPVLARTATTPHPLETERTTASRQEEDGQKEASAPEVSSTVVASPEKSWFESLGDWLFEGEDKKESAPSPKDDLVEPKKDEDSWLDSLVGAAGKWISDWLKKDDDSKTQASGTAGTPPRASVANGATVSNGANAPSRDSSFEASIAAVLPEGTPTDPISEEDLFAAVLHERIHTQVGPEAAGAYLEALRAEVGARVRADGYQPVEDATLAALQKLVETGALTSAQGDALYSQAFHAAQLDSNDDLLFDGRGGPGDETVATAPRGEAIARALERLRAIDSGESPAPRSLAEALATGTAAKPRDVPDSSASTRTGRIDGPDGFLWKPVSESDGNLVVLLPRDWANARSVVVRDEDGRVIARGTSRGRANGDREHFRFDRPGAAFPPGSVVTIELPNGRRETITIEDPASRWD